MTSEQLLATRATLWRQKAEPLLTLDDAQSWLLQSGLSLFLPRKAQIPAPAPSFVEAVLGETSLTPPRAAIETAKDMLVRLIESDSALPLNLLGTPTDHPDFLVSKEALPFVYALRGDRDWKHAPGTAGAGRVSPLISHIWKLMEKRGVLTATEIQEELGKELTEAAVLRALHELWGSMRVIPLYQSGGQETLWEPLQSRHQKAMNSGIGMSQVTALSVLVSVYLQSVVAATSDDAESFLSPLASRSKVREVIRGLSATRQLSLIQMESQSLLYVEGSLPEFPEAEKSAEEEAAEAAKKLVRRPHPTAPKSADAAPPRRSAASSAYQKRDQPAGDRPARPAPGGGGSSFRPAARGSQPTFRPKTARPTTGPSFSRPSSAPIERSEPGTGLRSDGSPKKTRWRDMPGGRPDQKGKPARFGPRKAEGSEGTDTPRPYTPRREAGSFRPATGSKPPYQRSSTPGEGRPFRPAASGRTYGASRPTGTGRTSGSSRPGGSFRPAGAGGSSRPTRPSFGAGSRDSGRPPSRPFNTGRPPIRSSDGGSGSRPPARSGAGRFVARPEGSRPYSRPRSDEGGGPGRPREGASAGGDRKFTPRPPRAGGFSSDRPRTGGSKPYTPRSGGSSTGGRPSYGKPGAGRPTSGGSSSYGRPSTGRPASGGSSYGRPSTGRPAFGGRPSTGRPAGGRPTGGAGYKSSGPGSGPRPGGRPGFGQGPRPGGAGRSGPSTGRPRTGAGPKPGGRPPSKFKKRPE